jgi:5-methylcytosine-specific restriction endonuclease McrA
VAWRSSKDPLLSSPLLRRNREVLRRRRLPCAVCGCPIAYDVPGAFVAGHIVSRYKAKRLGWTEAMINSLSNLQPECKRCSHRTGAREGNQAKRAMRQGTRPGRVGKLVNDAHRW